MKYGKTDKIAQLYTDRSFFQVADPEGGGDVCTPPLPDFKNYFFRI